MGTVKIKASDFLQMQQTIQSLETQLHSIRNVFSRYITSDDQDLRNIVKQFLEETNTSVAQSVLQPEITAGDINISPVLLEGKWSDLAIDTKQLRKQSWREY